MKKYRLKNGIAIGILAMMVLAACGKNALPSAEALTVSVEGKTGLGIEVGSSFEELAEAYEGFEVESVDADGTWSVYTWPKSDKNTERTTEDMILAVSCMYVDDAPVSMEQLEENLKSESLNDIDISNISKEIITSDYLSDHRVVYRYVFFTINDNKVSGIQGDYLDYNNEVYADSYNEIEAEEE